MSLAQWDGLAPLAAVAALAILALTPDSVFSAPNAWLNSLEDVPDGQAVAWSDPATGEHGMIVPADHFRDLDGSWCRSYELRIDGAAARTTHLACRVAGGGWREQPPPPVRAVQVRHSEFGHQVARAVTGAPL
jgi:surface antigen